MMNMEEFFFVVHCQKLFQHMDNYKELQALFLRLLTIKEMYTKAEIFMLQTGIS